MCVVEAKYTLEARHHIHTDPDSESRLGWLQSGMHAFTLPPHIYLCTQAGSIVFPTASKSVNRNVRVCCIENMLEKQYIHVITRLQNHENALLKSGVSFLIIQCFDFAWCMHCRPILFSGGQETKQNTAHVSNVTRQPSSAKLPQGCRYKAKLSEDCTLWASSGSLPIRGACTASEDKAELHIRAEL